MPNTIPGQNPDFDPQRLLEDLDPEQREAVLATSGPLAILAGAGSGKTRVISRRAAYAIAAGVVPADQVLIVTFTDKAAGEMVDRLRILGLPGVTARTFHAHALRQLRFYWPGRHDGQPLPALLDSKALMVSRLARQLPGHYRFTPAKDLADEIEWAKSRRIAPQDYIREVVEGGDREPPIPADLFVGVYAGYERAKTRANRIDFDDLLVETINLLETDEAAAATVRARKRWFSVDEYQDTNPLQQRLLELWVGDSPDLCVVGDEDQTIYTFTGATSRYLAEFAGHWPGAREVALVRNYRSTPQILELANRLIAADGREKRLVATRSDGPPPTILKHSSAEHELNAIVTWVRGRIADGIAPAEIAILVRMNAQMEPIEEAFTQAAIAYQVRGVRFYDRPEVRGAVAWLRRTEVEETGLKLAVAIRRGWAEAVGWAEGEATPEGFEARERQAALDTLLGIVDAVIAADPGADARSVIAQLEARAAHERDNAGEGVNLLTYHRAKGLEWDAVYLPSLEEGILPVRHAKDDDAALAEERRLLYVGITRARTHLALSWAERRETRGKVTKRQPSAFLADLRPRAGTKVTIHADPPRQTRPPKGGTSGDPVFDALRAWRTEEAHRAQVPAYVVAQDATLQAIAEVRPRSLPALRRVKGMGPARIDSYGDAILAIVAAALAPQADA